MGYDTIQNDRSWTIAYNPETKDAYFVTRLNIYNLADGYLEAFPQTGNGIVRTLTETLQNINANGWPVLQGV